MEVLEFKDLVSVNELSENDSFIITRRNVDIPLESEDAYTDYRVSYSTLTELLNVQSAVPSFLTFIIGDSKPEGTLFQDDLLKGDVKFDFRINGLYIRFSIIDSSINKSSGELNFENSSIVLVDGDEVNIIIYGIATPESTDGQSDDNGNTQTDDNDIIQTN